jgi:hypothetical protein
VPCDQLVERIDQAAGMEGAESAGDQLGEAYLSEECDAPACVTGQKRAVTAHKPPALAAIRRGDVSEQPGGFGISQTKQCEIFTSVEPGDDTRREFAEPSGARIEHRRAWERYAVAERLHRDKATPFELTRLRESEIDLRRRRVGPSRRDDLRPRVEVDALGTVDVTVAEEARLPAAK